MLLIIGGLIFTQYMRFNSLNEWLQWQQTLNPKEIDLGLERVSQVLTQLSLSADFFCPVISIAGTNGKGSTQAFIESILHHSAISVGCYSSPHLFNYNERIRINQQALPDEEICEAFERVDQARGQLPLTYFEFATLASLVLFKKHNVDVVVLEVGLGGRLDAVNIINADVSVITSIAIDHVQWLGHNLEQIAREKAGIMRRGKPSIISLFKPPKSLLEHAQKNQVPLIRLGQDYLYQGLAGGGWQLNGTNLHLAELAAPALKGGFQMQNAAAAIMAIEALKLQQNMHYSEGLKNVQLAGRYQQIKSSPKVIVDVAHNEQSAQMLAHFLNENPIEGKTFAIIAMLEDKAVCEVLQALDAEIDAWLSAGLSVTRGLDAINMAQAVRDIASDGKLSVCESVSNACEKVMTQMAQNDRVIIFGSFYTVAEASRYFTH